MSECDFSSYEPFELIEHDITIPIPGRRSIPLCVPKAFVPKQEDFMERIYDSINHGLIRGLSESFRHTLLKHSVNQTKAKIISKLTYFSGMFLLNFHKNWNSHLALGMKESLTLSFQNTIKLILTAVVLNVLNYFCQAISSRAENKRYTNVAKVFSYLGSGLTCGIFAYQGCKDGFRTTVCQVAAGFGTEKVVTTISDRLTDFMRP